VGAKNIIKDKATGANILEILGDDNTTLDDPSIYYITLNTKT